MSPSNKTTLARTPARKEGEENTVASSRHSAFNKIVEPSDGVQTVSPHHSMSLPTACFLTTPACADAPKSDVDADTYAGENRTPEVTPALFSKKRLRDFEDDNFPAEHMDDAIVVAAAAPSSNNTTLLTTAPLTKKVKRDRNAEAQEKVMKLPCQSIKAINMPPRVGFVVGQPVPEPQKGNLPFGETEDFNNSMIIHYLDELEVTYTKAAELYSVRFPRDPLTDEAIRKRHIRCLLRLWAKYGLKDVRDIEQFNANVRRRGIARAKRLRDVEPDASHSGSSTPLTSSQGSMLVPTFPLSAFTAQAPTQTSVAGASSELRERTPRDFEKACIVVWRDADKLEWKAIRDKLEARFDWSLGIKTIEKYYYTSFDRVYESGHKEGKNAQNTSGVALEGNSEAVVGDDEDEEETVMVDAEVQVDFPTSTYKE